MRRVTSDAVTVRRVVPGDAGKVRAIRMEMLADAPLAFIETLAQAAERPHADFEARVAASAEGGHSARFVADAGCRLVGHVGALADSAGRTWLVSVYVSPSHRRTGLLDALVDAAAQWSLAYHRQWLALTVVSSNLRARRAYERLGFHDTGVRVPHLTVATLTEIEMIRHA
ncbi:MAG TPA: GNAT family N-acetyltransferase [Micromonosporaceae bacterium]